MTQDTAKSWFGASVSQNAPFLGQWGHLRGIARTCCRVIAKMVKNKFM